MMDLKKLWEPVSSSIRSSARRHRTFTACILGLLLISAVDVAIVAVRFGPQHKLGPNRIISPWDVSNAPPPCIHRSTVRLAGAHAKTQAAVRPKPAPNAQRAQQVARTAIASAASPEAN